MYKTKPVVKAFQVPKEIRNQVSSRWSNLADAYRELGFNENEFRIDQFYRVMRGEKCNKTEHSLFLLAYRIKVKTSVDRTLILDILKTAAGRLQNLTGIPWSVSETVDEINKHNKLNPF